MNTDPELPEFVYWGGFTGLILLGISIVLFITFSVLYNEASDSSVTLEQKKFSNIETGLYLSYLTIGSLGFLMCLLIPYAHHLKSFNDPSVVSTKNGLHFETVDPFKAKITTNQIIKPPNTFGLPGEGGFLPTGDLRSKFDTSFNKFL